MNFKEFLNERLSDGCLTLREIDAVINSLRAEKVYVYAVKATSGAPGQFKVGPSRELAERVKKLLLKKYENIKVKVVSHKNGNYFLDVEGKIL